MIVPPRQIRVVNGRIYTAGSTCPDDLSNIRIVEKNKAVVEYDVGEVEVTEDEPLEKETLESDEDSDCTPNEAREYKPRKSSSKKSKF